MSEKISTHEPADRPRTVALSDAEVLALINYHIAQAKRVTKTVGEKLCDLRSGSIFKSRASSSALIEHGRKLVRAHLDRATGLQSFLKS